MHAARLRLDRRARRRCRASRATSLGADINATGQHADTSVLRWALQMPRAAFLRSLLAHPRAARGAKHWFAEIVLPDVAVAGLSLSVDVLLTRLVPGASAAVLGKALRRACRRCATASVVDVAALLIEHGASLSVDGERRTGAFFANEDASALAAALGGAAPPEAQSALVALLLRAGADVSADDELLVKACVNKCSLEIVNQLIAARAPASVRAVFAAARAGASAAVLDAIGDVLQPPLDVTHATDERGNTLLHFAQIGVDVLTRLIDAGADVHARNQDGLTPLMVVSPEHDDEFFLLLSRGADPSTDIRGVGGGYSVLHQAVATARPERVRRLLAAGANADARDGAGETALFYAMDGESTRLLLAAGLSPNELVGGRTPLIAALRRPDVLAALLSGGGELEPSLLYTCMRNCVEHTNLARESYRRPEPAESDALAARCAQLLIDAGADVHAAQFGGETALHMAVQRANGRRSLLTLLRNGALADLERAADDGRTARDFADLSYRGPYGLSARMDIAAHDGVLMLVAAGVEPLPAWIAPLSAPPARERIERFRFEIARHRATEIVMALHGLDASALELVHIVEAACGELPFARVWRLVTTVKHFKR